MRQRYIALAILLIGVLGMVAGCTATEPGYMIVQNTPLPVDVDGTIPTPTVTVTIPDPLPVTPEAGSVWVIPTPVAVTVPTPLPVTIPTPVPVTAPTSTPVPVVSWDDYGFDVENTPMNEMRVSESVKVAGTTFIGNTLDPNFWQTNLVGTGAVTQSGGQVAFTTGATANSAAYMSSVRRGRYVAGFSMRYRAVIQQDIGTANNVRTWGVSDWTTLPTVTDGAWYQESGGTFSIVTMRGGSATTVSSGSFNGKLGPTYTLNSSVHTYEIYWTNSRVYFSIDGQLLHTVSAGAAPWSNTPTLYIWQSNVNSGGSTTNVTMNTRVVSIARLGVLTNSPIYKHITSGTTICKYGAGTLHKLVINSPANATITVYDNTAASGAILAVITTLPNTQPFQLDYDMDFYTGLTIVTSATIDVTAVYE